ncbi:MAG: hypothetical protein H7Y22_13625 [Gemmatimonadaceae bacterium]|nr:hypothetical protein [Gloeobacterales cyanobacterium ES-bin-141]
MLRICGWLLSVYLVGLVLPAQAVPLDGAVSLVGDDPQPVQGVAHILEDTADNRLAIERMAKALQRTAFQRRRAGVRVAGAEGTLQELAVAHARVQGLANRLVAMALSRAQVSAPVTDGRFVAEVPFERQLLVVVAQTQAKIGWWVQGTAGGLPVDLAEENALLVRALSATPGVQGTDDMMSDEEGN